VPTGVDELIDIGAIITLLEISEDDEEAKENVFYNNNLLHNLIRSHQKLQYFFLQ
jgi:hypothetical protein